MIPFLANGLWYLLLLPDSSAFRRAMQDIATTQRQLLLRLLHRNAQTEWGQRYGFADIRTIQEYQHRVPLTTWDDYQHAVEQISAGQQRVLTHEPVLLLEPTSGSTATTKYIPYTASLKREFQQAVAPWIVNLYTLHPSLLRGQAYWSVSPVTRRNQRTPGGIPVGFDDDSNYFGRVQHWLINQVMAVPPLVRLIEDIDSFRYVSLLFLLRSRSLRFISVWNPTFLTLLVAPLRQWWPLLSHDIAHGTLSTPSPLDANLHRRLAQRNRPDKRRAVAVETICRTNADDAGAIHAALWPGLHTVSCWADAASARHIPTLRRLFPQAQVQGKGLLATEGCVSFPLVGAEGAALAICSHFFEFIPTDPQEGIPRLPTQPMLAHELEAGMTCSVILTSGGGLYRYHLHDLVRVTGFVGRCPLLRFLGKAAHISDHYGEKLHAYHVQQFLDTLLDRAHSDTAFALVACEQYGDTAAYTLFIETAACNDETLLALGRNLESMLCENYHYRYCRDLGQLGALRVFRIARDGTAAYMAQCQRLGQRPGDIKPSVLHQRGGWLRVFAGQGIGGYHLE